jgi:hypothetical protein
LEEFPRISLPRFEALSISTPSMFFVVTVAEALPDEVVVSKYVRTEMVRVVAADISGKPELVAILLDPTHFAVVVVLLTV